MWWWPVAWRNTFHEMASTVERELGQHTLLFASAGIARHNCPHNNRTIVFGRFVAKTLLFESVLCMHACGDGPSPDEPLSIRRRRRWSASWASTRCYCLGWLLLGTTAHITERTIVFGRFVAKTVQFTHTVYMHAMHRTLLIRACWGQYGRKRRSCRELCRP